jgi:hypothetical protein
MPATALRRVLCLAFSIPATVPAVAQQGYRVDPAGKDELWDVQTTMEMEGMRMAMPGGPQRVCIEKGNDESSVPKQDGCTVIEGRRVGNKYRFKMHCKKGRDDYTAEGENSYSGNAYEGWMVTKGTMDGRPADMKMTYSGTRAGNCVSTVRQDIANMEARGKAETDKFCRDAVDKLMWQAFESGAACAAKRKDFAAAMTKASTEMRDPVQHVAYTKKNADIKTAFAKYDLDYAATTRSACARAAETRNYTFIGSGNCDDDVRRLGRGICDPRGRSPEQQYYPMCARYAALTRGQGGEDAVTAGSPAGRAGAAAPAKSPTPADATQQTIDAVRKLLPF